MLPSRQFAPPPSEQAPRAAWIGARLVPNQATVALLGYAALALIVCAAAWRSPATVAIGNPLDLPQFLWFLRWFPFAIAHGQSLLLSDYIAYPGGVNLMWNTSIPLLGVLLSPVTVLASPVIALNVLTTLGPALSAWTAFLALRRYVRHWGAAVVGGTVFGFSPYVMSQSLGHPQLAFAALVPLICMTLDEVLIRGRRPAIVVGVALGALGAAQLLVGEEVLVICGITTVLGIVLLAALHRGEVAARLPYIGTAMAVATTTFGLLAAYPVSVQLFGPEQAHGPLQPASIYVTNVLALVIPSVRQLFAPGSALELSSHFSGTMENGSYLGLPLIGLVYWMARRQWSRGIVRWAVLLTTTIVVLSMGSELRVVGVPTGVPMPWQLVGGAPVLDHLLPVRLMGTAFLSAGLLVALFVDQAMASGSGTQRRFALAVTGLAVLALVPRPLPVLPATPPPFFTTGAISQVRPGSVALVAPFSQAYTGSVAMGWQAQAGFRFRMPDEYAYGPNWLSPPDSETQTAMAAIQLTGARPPLGEPDRRRLLEDLRRWHVETVIVGPMDNQPVMVDFMTRLLGRPPVEDSGVFVWWNVDRIA